MSSCDSEVVSRPRHEFEMLRSWLCGVTSGSVTPDSTSVLGSQIFYACSHRSRPSDGTDVPVWEPTVLPEGPEIRPSKSHSWSGSLSGQTLHFDTHGELKKKIEKT